MGFFDKGGPEERVETLAETRPHAIQPIYRCLWQIL